MLEKQKLDLTFANIQIYISLGGNRKGKWYTYRNLLLTMILGGLWHGAAWNFVLWGVFHGIILVIYRLVEPLVPWNSDTWPWPARFINNVGRWAVMFALTLFGWLLFRATSVANIAEMISSFSFTPNKHTGRFVQTILFYAWPLLLMQLAQHISGNLMVALRLPMLVLGLLLGAMIAITLGLGVRESMEFIYFQF